MRRLRSTAVALILAALLVALLAAPAGAVTYGERDVDDEHPYVGMAIFLVEDDGGQLQPAWLCSGSLIDAEVFLTAAHCTAGADGVVVQFGENQGEGFTDPEFVVFGSPVTHPDWDDFESFPQTNDVGVVELASPVQLDSYPDVAGAGYVDDLVDQRKRSDIEFTVVGYGIQHSQITGAEINEDGEPEITFDDTIDGWRHVGTVGLVTLNSAHTDGYNIHHTGNPGRRSGGTCFGDSGGPVLHEGTIVAVTSFGIGNQMCRGNTGFAYRMDIESSQEFLAEYLD